MPHQTTNQMRRCNHCKTEKPLEDFNRRSSNPLGRAYWCRSCSVESSRSRVQLLNHRCINCDKLITISKSNLCKSCVRIGRYFSNSYSAIHQSLLREYGKAPLCIFDNSHESNNYEWANVTGEYTRNLEDYLPMCQSCHRKFDWSEKQRVLSAQRLKENRIAIRCKIAQYYNGRLVKIHECLADAARAAGLHHVTIHDQIEGRLQTAGGYQWKRIE